MNPKNLSLVGPPHRRSPRNLSACVWLANRQLPGSSAWSLPTSRPCTHGGLVHTSARSFLFIWHAFHRLQSPYGSSRASRRARSRHLLRLAANKLASSRSGHGHLVGAVAYLHTQTSTLPRGSRCLSRPSRRLLAPTNTNWLCSTLLLFRCAGLQVRGHKKPRRPQRHIGTALRNVLRSSSALPWLLDVAPFPSRRRFLTVVNASLVQRTSNYTTSSLDKANRRAQAGRQPSGVGRLKVRLACVERATIMRTGSLWLVFISMCTRCGGTHTKSPAWAS